MPISFPRLAWALPLVALTACGPKPSSGNGLNSLDAELAGNSLVDTGDPAIRRTLQDQITVDPKLASPSNKHALRSPQQPNSGARPPDSMAPDNVNATAGDASKPSRQSAGASSARACPECKIKSESVTLGALARRQADKRTPSCARELRYSTTWALRLPVDLPVYPDARVDEAAGSGGACALRVVSFSTGASTQAVVDWYFRRLTVAGYAPEIQANRGLHVLGGIRSKDGAACVIYVERRSDRRTHIDLVANNGN